MPLDLVDHMLIKDNIDRQTSRIVDEIYSKSDIFYSTEKYRYHTAKNLASSKEFNEWKKRDLKDIINKYNDLVHSYLLVREEIETQLDTIRDINVKSKGEDFLNIHNDGNIDSIEKQYKEVPDIIETCIYDPNSVDKVFKDKDSIYGGWKCAFEVQNI